ncbi:MAG TPA: hypothetical protein VN829_00975, partial [Dongiaceae bacterium]|nr:hypothetical protein [Dongiaceae bacterium]
PSIGIFYFGPLVSFLSAFAAAEQGREDTHPLNSAQALRRTWDRSAGENAVLFHERHVILTGEVEDDFQGFGRCVDDVDGVGKHSLRIAILADEVHLPFCFGDYITGVEPGFVEGDELCGSTAEAVEELFAPGQCEGKIGGSNALRFLRPGNHEDVGELGDKGGNVPSGVVAREGLEETLDGSGGLFHEKPPIFCCKG